MSEKSNTIIESDYLYENVSWFKFCPEKIRHLVTHMTPEEFGIVMIQVMSYFYFKQQDRGNEGKIGSDMELSELQLALYDMICFDVDMAFCDYKTSVDKGREGAKKRWSKGK